MNLLLFILLLLHNTYGKWDEIDEKIKELKDLDREIIQKEKIEQEYQKKEKITEKEIQSIEKALKKVELDIEYILRKIRANETEIKSVTKQIYECEWRIKEIQKILCDEINDYYREYLAIWRLSYNPIVKKMRQCLIDNKLDLMNTLFFTNKSLKQLKSELDRKKIELNLLKIELTQKVNEQKKLLSEKSAILESLREKRRKVAKDLEELREAAKKLSKLIEDLRKKQAQVRKIKPEVSLPPKSLPPPVNGEIVLKFGKFKHPELDTFFVSNGIKIKPYQNSNITAISNGEVVFVGDFYAYGKTIIIDHGNDFYTIYSQLGDILVKENDKVLKGQNIATSANNPEGIIYFEMRLGGQSVDPLIYINF